MANETGFWTSNKAVTVENLNACLLQKGDPAAFTNTLKGMVVWKNSTNELYYCNGAGFEVAVPKDAAAATPSLRTLGTGATQAAAGNHTHLLVEGVNANPTKIISSGTGGTTYYYSSSGTNHYTNTLVGAGKTGRMIVAAFSFSYIDGGPVTAKLKIGGVEVASASVPSGGTTGVYAIAGSRQTSAMSTVSGQLIPGTNATVRYTVARTTSTTTYMARLNVIEVTFP